MPSFSFYLKRKQIVDVPRPAACCERLEDLCRLLHHVADPEQTLVEQQLEELTLLGRVSDRQVYRRGRRHVQGRSGGEAGGAC